MKVKIKLNGGIMPQKATAGAAAYDLYVPEDTILKPGRQVIDLKFSIELPHGYAATIQPRSGFSAKGMEVICSYSLSEFNMEEYTRMDADVTRGLIDEDYRGNVGVIVYCKYGCNPEFTFTLLKGTRIAQMQIVEVPQVELIEVEELSVTDRGEGGFGHTGAR